MFLLVSTKRITWHCMRAFYKATRWINEVQRSRLNNTKYLYIVVNFKL